MTPLLAVEQPLDRAVVVFVGLLIVAAVVAVIVRRLPIPYITALAVAGALLGTVASSLRPHLTSSLILFIVLPGLIFESAFNLRWARVRRDLLAVVVLATAGVAVTMTVVALLAHDGVGLSVPAAIVVGAALAATDPVAVTGVFRRLGAPARLAAFIEAESLLNDGTGVVAFGLALTAAGVGSSTGAGEAVLAFVRLAGGGVTLGLVVGAALSRLTRRIDDQDVELTYTTIGAYGTYVLAETAHVSGILAVVACAIVLGNYGRSHGMSERTRAAVDTVWGYVAFILNSVVFLLIGLTTPLADVLSEIGIIAALAAIAVVARAVAVYAVLLPFHLTRRGFPNRWTLVIVWSGMRGAVAIALVLGLPDRGGGPLAQMRTLVYGVVLLSIVVQGATIGPLTAALIPAEQRSPRHWSPPWLRRRTRASAAARRSGPAGASGDAGASTAQEGERRDRRAGDGA